jgi:hypothetical protein
MEIIMRRVFLGAMFTVLVMLFGNLSYGDTLPIVLQGAETELTAGYLVRKIPATVPFYRTAYISYELRGNYGSIPSAAVATTGNAWFYVSSCMGGINIDDPSVWRTNYLAFHLDKQVYLDRGAREFSTGTVFNSSNIVLIKPSSDVTATVDGYSVTFESGLEYPVRITADNQGPFNSPEALLNSDSWALPLECYLTLNTSFGQNTS